MSEDKPKKRRMSAPQAAALVLFFTAFLTTGYGALTGGNNVLIIVGLMGVVMGLFLWRVK